ncbi:Serine/threonine-protein kinase TIO [Apostasia shenzhenica]|uniref:non-specific serine/threonine protein kinase n=1 Tax=Apostasia shenzhenica TaxID=1088818 RepID=A0A2I0AI13_9ASPA|nr:Serine/threonine-protein kinase TIO [Apostasia shenzhenica]
MTYCYTSMQSLSVLKKLLDNSGRAIRSSYRRHWVVIADLYSQSLVSVKETSGRILYEFTACIAVMLLRLALGLKTLMATDAPEKVSCSAEETLIQIVDHARTSGIVEVLCEFLVTSGSSLMSGSSNMVPAACEVCKSIWYLIEAMETISLKKHTYLFPLDRLRHEPDFKTSITGQGQGLLTDDGADSLIGMISKIFLLSKAMQVSFYCCFHNGLESTLHAVVQVNLLLMLIRKYTLSSVATNWWL